MADANTIAARYAGQERQLKQQVEAADKDIARIDDKIVEAEKKIKTFGVEDAKGIEDQKGRLEGALEQAETKATGIKSELAKAKDEEKETSETKKRLEAEVMSIERETTQMKDKINQLKQKREQNINANKAKLLDFEAILEKLELIISSLRSDQTELKVIEAKEINLERKNREGGATAPESGTVSRAAPSQRQTEQRGTAHKYQRVLPDSEITNPKIREMRSEQRMLARELMALDDALQKHKRTFDEFSEIVERMEK